MNSLSEVIQLSIGAIVGLGLSLTMEKNGITIFCRETREKAISYLIIFICAWIIGMTLILDYLAD